MPTLTQTPERGQFPLNVKFVLDTSDMETILYFEWDFGDGKKSKERSPEHVYFMAGKYHGSVTITNQFGDQWSTTFTIYVYDWDLTGSEGGTNVSFTDKCYRIAINPNQGIGIVPWGIGGDLPFPEARVGTVKGLNKANQAISLILDNRSGLFYRIGVKEIWQDKIGVYGQGAEINSMVRLKENISVLGEEGMVEHIESHIHERPQDESYKDEDGFTEKGFLESHRINLKMFANGDTVNPIAKLKNVTQYGDYVFSKRIENKRLQLQIETTTSAFKITTIKQHINNIDKVTPDGIGGIKTEVDFINTFRGSDLWITRDSKSPLLNRSSGNNVSGSYDSLTEGPDGKSNSALSFLAADALSVSLSQKAFPSTLIFWIGDLAVVGDVFKFDTAGPDNLIIRIVQPGAFIIRLTNDGAWTHDVQLEWSGTGWVQIAISSDGTVLNVYENGVLKGIVDVPAWLTSYGGTVDIVGAAIISMFDIRRIPRKLSSDAIQWFYDDVVNNNGSGGLLPLMR